MLLKDALRYELPVEGNSLLGYIVRRQHKTEWLMQVRQPVAKGETARALAHIAAYAVSTSSSFVRAHCQPRFDEPGTQISAPNPATGGAVTARLLSAKPDYRIGYDVTMPDSAVFDGAKSFTGTTIGPRGLGMPTPSQFAFQCGVYEAKLKGLLTSELLLSLLDNTRIRVYGKLDFQDNAGNSGSIELERNGKARLVVNGKDVVLEGTATTPAA